MIDNSNHTEIEKLATRIAELEEENARLRSVDETIGRNTAMFEAMVANSSAGIALIGPDRRIVRVICSAMGYSPGEVNGAPLESVIHPDDRGLLIECYEQVLNNGMKTAEFEGRFCRADGSVGWVLAKFTDQLDDPNVQAIICNSMDVTLYKKCELVLSEFAALVEDADGAVFSEDLDGKVVTWNRGAQRLFGYGSDEIAGRHIWLLVPTELREEEGSMRQKVAESRQPLDFRTIRACRDGSRFPLLVRLTPVLDRYGRPRGISQLCTRK